MSDNEVFRSYAASSPEDQQATYDTWADSYERDLCAMGYRLPASVCAALQHVESPQTDRQCAIVVAMARVADGLIAARARQNAPA